MSGIFLDNSDVHLKTEVALHENMFTELIQKMLSKHFNISVDQEPLLLDKCKLLFEKDYVCKVVNNCNYTMSYPTGIIVPVGKKSAIDGTVPDAVRNLESLDAYRSFVSHLDRDALSSVLSMDVETVKYLKIEYVCDLMTRYTKIFNDHLCLGTTEKGHEDLYVEVKMEEMPYPGSQFFPTYHKAGRDPKDLFCDMKETAGARGLNLTEDFKLLFPEINVDDFQNWNLIQLTQNYLKVLLSDLVTGTGGILVHCSSGWDRTPVFMTLLRLSLWADGVVHENLDFQDIAYLTLAYDWFLFGHKFPYRLQTKEEILHFCFNFLKQITSDEYSVTRLFHELPTEKKRNRIFPEFVPGRRGVLDKIRDLVLDLYNKEIIQEKRV